MQPCRLEFQACCRGALLAQQRERVGARRRYVAMCRPAAKRRTSDRQLFAAEAQQRSRPAPSQVASPARCGGDCTARRWPRAALPAPPPPVSGHRRASIRWPALLVGSRRPATPPSFLRWAPTCVQEAQFVRGIKFGFCLVFVRKTAFFVRRLLGRAAASCSRKAQTVSSLKRTQGPL